MSSNFRNRNLTTHVSQISQHSQFGQLIKISTDKSSGYIGRNYPKSLNASQYSLVKKISPENETIQNQDLNYYINTNLFQQTHKNIQNIQNIDSSIFDLSKVKNYTEIESKRKQISEKIGKISISLKKSIDVKEGDYNSINNTNQERCTERVERKISSNFTSFNNLNNNEKQNNIFQSFSTSTYGHNKNLQFKELSIPINTNYNTYKSFKVIPSQKKISYSISVNEGGNASNYQNFSQKHSPNQKHSNRSQYQSSQEIESMFKTGYFSSIIDNYKNKTKKVSVKSLDPECRLNSLINFGTMMNSVTETCSIPVINENLFMTEGNGKNCDKENPDLSSKKLKNKKKKISSNILPLRKDESKDHTKQRVSFLTDEQIICTKPSKFNTVIDENQFKSKPLKTILSLNKKIVDENKNVKILCYKTPMEKEILVKNLLTQDITENYNIMTRIKSKFKIIQSEDSYKRIKNLESKLPTIIKKNTGSIDVTWSPKKEVQQN